MKEPGLDAVLERIEKLERQAQVLRVLLFTAIAGILVLGTAAGTIAQQNSFSASNSSGSVKIDADGFAMYDAAGNRRITIGFNSLNQPGIYLWDSGNVDRLGAYLTGDGDPVVRLTNAQKDDLAFFGLTPDAHEPRISFQDSSGTQRLYLGLTTSESGSVRVYDKAGTERVYAGEYTDGSAGFSAYNSGGTSTWSSP
jgi:hypothetical protein